MEKIYRSEYRHCQWLSICHILSFAMGCLLMQGCKKDPGPSTGDNAITNTSFYSGVQYFEYSDSAKYNVITYSPVGGIYAINVGLNANIGNEVRMISDSLNSPLFEGQVIKMPYFAYYGPYSDHGTLIENGKVAQGAGSTVAVTVTRVGSHDFDAVFSGKVWSARDAARGDDTLFIHDGSLSHVKLPSIH